MEIIDISGTQFHYMTKGILQFFISCRTTNSIIFSSRLRRRRKAGDCPKVPDPPGGRDDGTEADRGRSPGRHRGDRVGAEPAHQELLQGERRPKPEETDRENIQEGRLPAG